MAEIKKLSWRVKDKGEEPRKTIVYGEAEMGMRDKKTVRSGGWQLTTGVSVRKKSETESSTK